VLQSLKNAQGIILIHDVQTLDSNTYIITELCEGGDLAKLISAKRGLPEVEALKYLKQIVRGYLTICGNRIIHRDLKPANLLLKNGEIRIADFGFAIKSTESKKMMSYNVGSPIYMPP
jgi:serine/threonine protein kinase